MSSATNSNLSLAGKCQVTKVDRKIAYVAHFRRNCDADCEPRSFRSEAYLSQFVEQVIPAVDKVKKKLKLWTTNLLLVYKVYLFIFYYYILICERQLWYAEQGRQLQDSNQRDFLIGFRVNFGQRHSNYYYGIINAPYHPEEKLVMKCIGN